MDRNHNLYKKLVAWEVYPQQNVMGVVVEIGYIVEMDPLTDIAIVKSINGFKTSLPTSKLWMLKDRTAIIQNIIRYLNLPNNDFNKITTIANLYRQGKDSVALLKAMENKVTRQVCLLNAKSFIQIREGIKRLGKRKR